MSDGIDPMEYGAMLSGMSVAQFTEVVERVCEAFRDQALTSAELTPGLTFDDRRWVRDMADIPYVRPSRNAAHWLRRLHSTHKSELRNGAA